MASWRVSAYVRESTIERHEQAIFVASRLCETDIRRTGESFVAGGLGFMAVVGEESCHASRKILVDFELQ